MIGYSIELIVFRINWANEKLMKHGEHNSKNNHLFPSLSHSDL